MNKTVGILSSAAVFVTPAMAHPAHHDLSPFQSLSHLLTQPDHLAVLAIAIAGVAFVLGRLSRRKI